LGCIALGDDRQYGGNRGYDDDLTTKYSYDSNVPNHKQVSKGDLIVLRDSQHALGVARVEEVTSGRGTKLIQRCPECRSPNLKERVKKRPRWRCSNGHEFEKPLQREQPVAKYVARFNESFIRIDKTITAGQLKGIALRPSDQLSMEELDLAGFERLLLPSEKSLELVAAIGFVRSPAPDEADDEDATDVVLSFTDEREKLNRAIKVRRGSILQARSSQTIR